MKIFGFISPVRGLKAPNMTAQGSAHLQSAPVPGRSNVGQPVGGDCSETLARLARLRPGRARSGGFTMIEIALCLAIVGFALVSILLVLPSGMNTQSQTRQETIIGQDATELIEAIRNGAFGFDDLTNYVYAITNSYQYYTIQGQPVTPMHQAGYTYTSASIDGVYSPAYALTNGAHIVGLLSTPEFTTGFNGHALASLFNTAYVSNHVVACVRSLSGLAAEKPPQNNQIMQQGTFTYRVLCVNAPMAADTNMINNSSYAWQLADNLRELRLLYSWPLEPNGSVGPFRQSFRTSIAGRLALTSDPGNASVALYVYQSASFNNNAP